MILLMNSTHWSVQAQSSCDMCTSAYTHLGADGFNTFFIITIIGSVMTILTMRPWNVVRCIDCIVNWIPWEKSERNQNRDIGNNLQADWKLRLHIIQSQNPEGPMLYFLSGPGCTYLIFVIFYTTTFWGLKILHSKVRKFATNSASRQNSVNHHSRAKFHIYFTQCVKLHSV